MIKTNIKMRVTPEQSAKVQEICFKNGVKWFANGFNVVHVEKPYLFVWNDNTLAFGTSYCDFEEDIKEEIDPELFIRTFRL